MFENLMRFMFHVLINDMFLFQFVYQEALVTALSDMSPSFFKINYRRELLLLTINAGSFLIGLFMVTEVSGHEHTSH